MRREQKDLTLNRKRLLVNTLIQAQRAAKTAAPATSDVNTDVPKLTGPRQRLVLTCLESTPPKRSI
jgi:hypothetical protein